MKRLSLLILLSLAALLTLSPLRPPTQAQSGIVTMSIRAGFDGRFRDNMWTPVVIRLENTGAPFTGALVIRPERSRGLTNPVTTPVELPADTSRTYTLYVSLRSFTDLLRVELFTPEGLVAAESEAQMSVILPRERLYVRVSDSFAANIDLSTAAATGQLVAQANLAPDSLPDHPAGLEAIDILILNRARTEGLTTAQRDALRAWVVRGGHLMVAAGAEAEATTAGVLPLLPVIPAQPRTLTDFSPLAALAAQPTAPTATASTIASGALQDGAQALALTSDGQILVARRTLGSGTVDYLAFDPTAAPFDTWAGLPSFWQTLAISTAPRPSWSSGFVNLTQGYQALEILPGVTVLPEVTAMIVFLIAYVLLIGPINYFILSRINRRELAWLTIPALILGFTAIAWATGFNLRGEEVILSRLTVVESWPDSPDARARQLIGLLAPRRAQYTLALDDARALRPLLRANEGILANAPASVRIAQDPTFRAIDFPVDASFMAGFVTDGQIPKPELSGTLTITETSTGEQWRGTVENGLTTPLTEAVLLSKHGAYRLERQLNAGEILPVETLMPYPPDQNTAAATVQYAASFVNPRQSRYVVRGQDGNLGADATARAIIGDALYDPVIYFAGYAGYNPINLTPAQVRRQAFISNFIVDQFFTNGLGDDVYLIGWSSTTPTAETLPNIRTQTLDETLYITRLTTTRLAPSATVTAHPDDFTWLTVSDTSGTDSTPNILVSYTDSFLAYRFTPIPSKRLAEVETLTLVVTENDISFAETLVSLYDWQTGQYVPIELTGARTPIPRPARFLGPLNAVQAQVERALTGTALSISTLGFEQTGRLTPQMP